MMSPLDRQRERVADERVRQSKRDKEKKEAEKKGPPQALRAYRGTDHLGRPYDDIERTGAWRERARATEEAPDVSERFEYAEHRATLPGLLGYECTFYNGIRWRTAHLRESLYVAVEVKGYEFRPRGAEHFPADECFEYQGMNPGIGAGAPVEVLFRCYAPIGSGGAEEGVRAINAALEELAGRVGKGHWSRSMATGADKARYVKLVGLDGNAAPPAYRPPPGALPARGSAPEPAPSFAASVGDEITRQIRGHLERWGALEDYDRMKAEMAERREPVPTARSPYDPDPWTEQYQAYEEQQEAMQAEYGRWNGGGF